MVVKSMVSVAREHIYSIMTSPMLDNQNEHYCLYFSVLIKAAFEVNLLHANGVQKQIWRIRDGVYSQFSVFRVIVMPLPSGKYKIEFKSTFLPKGLVAALEYIQVISKSCLKPGRLFSVRI